MDQLPARALVDVLADVVDAEAAKRPLVTVTLAMGRDLSGWPLALDRQRHAVLVLRLADTQLRPSDDVVYLSLGMVGAVTVHQAARHAPLISGGTVPLPTTPPPNAPPPPTRLELKRRLAAAATGLGERLGTPLSLAVEWDGLPAGDEPFRALGELIDETVPVLTAISGDELGRGALAAVARVAFAEGSQAAVTRTGDTLVVAARLAFGPAGRLSAAALRSAIEAVL